MLRELAQLHPGFMHTVTVELITRSAMTCGDIEQHHQHTWLRDFIFSLRFSRTRITW